jgi:hypothetical protein
MKYVEIQDDEVEIYMVTKGEGARRERGRREKEGGYSVLKHSNLWRRL